MDYSIVDAFVVTLSGQQFKAVRKLVYDEVVRMEQIYHHDNGEDLGIALPEFITRLNRLRVLDVQLAAQQRRAQ